MLNIAAIDAGSNAMRMVIGEVNEAWQVHWTSVTGRDRHYAAGERLCLDAETFRKERPDAREPGSGQA